MKKIDLYHKLPHPFREITASAWGLYLRWWRYGSQSEELVAQFLERDTWSANQWQAYRENRLNFILERAYRKVPYYRDHWAARRRAGDQSSWQILENWPLLEKSQVSSHPRAFLAEDCQPSKMYVDHTGGTTGTPVNIYESRSTLQTWYALFEARMRRWNNVTYRDHWAILGGQMVAPLAQTKPPFWIRNFSSNQLYLSSFHLAPGNIPAYVDILNRYQPSHLIVYPSSLSLLAREILSQGLQVWQPRLILTNAEPLSETQRSLFSSAFSCPVVSTYGMSELVLAASECQGGKMHFFPDSGILEVIAEDEMPCAPQVSGIFVATGLLNPDMPLIRYKIGDRGSNYEFENCACGRGLPIMGNIEGRTSDLILTPDGRKIFWLNPIFYGLPILEGQVVQESLTEILVKVVPDHDFSPSAGQELAKRLQARLGAGVNITIEKVASIPRGPNGKFKPVISKVIE